jgi:pimeloyl-ACP methyl ester carboxylesterase
MKVYFIPGLGADSRAFNFLDLSFCEPVFIEWPTPLPHETLAAYAEKIFDIINDETATIVGLSFGGMIATEIAKQHPRTKAILISSAKTYKEIPAYLRFWRHLPVYKYSSGKTMRFSGKLVLNILGAKGEAQRTLQQQIIQSSDPAFTRWAMHAIVTWRNQDVPENIIHIHGSADKLLPYRYVKVQHTIHGGQHVMIMDRAKEVSELLAKLCNE